MTLMNLNDLYLFWISAEAALARYSSRSLWAWHGASWRSCAPKEISVQDFCPSFWVSNRREVVQPEMHWAMSRFTSNNDKKWQKSLLSSRHIAEGGLRNAQLALTDPVGSFIIQQQRHIHHISHVICGEDTVVWLHDAAGKAMWGINHGLKDHLP